MGNPDLLVLDEPSNGIDIKSQNEIYQLIKDLNRERKITVICVEHNLKAAIRNSHLLYHMSNGVGHMCNPQNYIKEYLMLIYRYFWFKREKSPGLLLST